MTDTSGGSGRPDPAEARSPGEFVDAMRRLKRWSGLGFRRLEQRASAAGDALPRSTVTAALARDTLPREDLVAAFARTCGCGADEVERWVAARRRLAAADSAQPADKAVPTTAVPAQLPPAVAGFVGRSRYLEELAVADQPIVVITGTAGVGKTTLAVYWGHQVAGQFPDGQLYLNLRGFDPAGPVMSAAEAIRTLLNAFDLPPWRIPRDFDAQVALYRSLLAGKRIFVLLDNAHDSGQVRPLLPGTPGCLAVVTSRDQLASLVASHGARPVTLDLLSTEDSRDLLAGRVGAARVAAEPAAVAAIVTGCSRLPLALAVVSARAALSPHHPLGTLAEELRDAHLRLDALDAGDPATDVRAVFSWSYRQLTEPAARMFRLIGLHPGPDISLAAAGSLAGIPPDQTRAALTDLTRAHLIQEHVPGRYTFHDLLRAQAADLARACDTENDRRRALRRMLDHYLYSAHSATRLLSLRTDRITLTRPDPGVTPERFTDSGKSLSWFAAENPVLLAAIGEAVADGFDTHAWQLAVVIRMPLNRQGHSDDCAGVLSTALSVTHRLGDARAESAVRAGLGITCTRLGRYGQARDEFLRALELCRIAGDELGAGEIHDSLTALCHFQNLPAEALVHAQQALALYRAGGDPIRMADAQNAVGWCHAQLGDYGQALAECRQAFALAREHGDRFGQAYTWDSLGYVHRHLGNHGEAIACYHDSLALLREFGDRYSQATTLTDLGHAYQDGGDEAAAHDSWRQALEIFDELNHPEGDQVRLLLKGMSGRAPVGVGAAEGEAR
jgi:tetratricopeptide (TPR) repeat protein